MSKSNFVYYKINRNSVAIVDNVPSNTLNTDKYIAKDNNGNVYFFNKNSNSFEVSSVFTILQMLLPFVSNLLLPLIQNILGVFNQMKLPNLNPNPSNPTPPFHLQFNNNSTQPLSPPNSPTTPVSPPNTPTNVAVNSVFSSQKHVDHNKSYRVDHNINQMTKCESFCESCPPTPMHRNHTPSLPLFPSSQQLATQSSYLPPSRPATPPFLLSPPQRPSTPPPQRPSTSPPQRPSTPPPLRPSTLPPQQQQQYMPSFIQQYPQVQQQQNNGYSLNNDYFKLMAPFPNYSSSYNTLQQYTPSVYSGYNQFSNKVNCNVYPL